MAKLNKDHFRFRLQSHS